MAQSAARLPPYDFVSCYGSVSTGFMPAVGGLASSHFVVVLVLRLRSGLLLVSLSGLFSALQSAHLCTLLLQGPYLEHRDACFISGALHSAQLAPLYGLLCPTSLAAISEARMHAC